MVIWLLSRYPNTLYPNTLYPNTLYPNAFITANESITTLALAVVVTLRL
jgi:hypothetical protein